MKTLACPCRKLYEEDFDSVEELLQRIEQPDLKCMHCVMRYKYPPPPTVELPWLKNLHSSFFDLAAIFLYN